MAIGRFRLEGGPFDGELVTVADPAHVLRIPIRPDLSAAATVAQAWTLTVETADALREHRRRQLEERLGAGAPTEDGLVFVRPDGRPYHGSKLTTLLYPILDRLGLPRVTVHALRHTSATVLYEMGVDINTIADMLGHSTPRITAELYRHKSATLQHEAADRMQEAVG